ncbi:MAG: DUF5723 family protein [Bacteroidia bacterium]|nr:DUF5723 family protein [Bacteroidia bacterium]
MRIVFVVLKMILIFHFTFGQNILGFSSGNFSGVSAVIQNPANAHGTCIFDLSVGGQAGFISNYFRISRDYLFHNFDKDKILNRNTTEFIEGNTKRHFTSSSYILMPSFLAKINEKSTMAFIWNIRNYMNFNEINNELAPILYNHFNYPSGLSKRNNSFNTYASTHLWAEYGLCYAREIIDNSKSNLTIGTTIKFLQGIQSFYAYSKDFSYELVSDSTMNIYSSYVYYGHSRDFNINPFIINYKMNGHPSFGLDFGITYYIKSKKHFNDITNYSVKFSASILDIGSIKYTKFNSNDFIADARNWNVKNLIFSHEVLTKNINDTIRKRFGFLDASTTYQMNLPTKLLLQADIRVYNKIFLNLAAQIPYRNNTTVSFSREYAFYSFMPRFESIKGFLISVPVHYFPMYSNTSARKVSAGMILQLGWITIGTNHLSDLVLDNNIKGFDIFLLMKFSSVFKKSRFYDKDKDGIQDQDDACPSIAGKKSLMGCPDKDDDNIADKDDKCPDLAGKLEMNGCPDKDNDGLSDIEDVCPDEPGDKSLKGCPDKDKDGIADKEDRCPDIAGVSDFSGCPPPVIDGNILMNETDKEPVSNVKLYLLKENCEKADSTITDNKGYFKFVIRDTTQTYYVKVNENEEIAKGKARFFMARNDTLIRITKNFPCDKFVFTQLPFQKYLFIDLKRDGILHIGGNLLILTDNNTTEALKNIKLIIKNQKGDIIDTITTNEFGSFTFKYLDYDQQYIITFAENDIQLTPGTKIILTNKNGKEIKRFIYFPGESFKFELLPYEKTILKDLEVEDTELNINIRGYLKTSKFEKLKKVKVIITDEESPVQDLETDSTGLFFADNLKFRKGISFVIPSGQKDSLLNKTDVILITDSKNRIIKRLVRGLGGDFKIQLLDLEKTTLAEYQINDPWLNVLKLKNKYSADTIKIREKINYALNAYKPDAEGYRVLDKVTQIMKDNPKLIITISSHTDSRGNDKQNLTLSEKRARFAYEYIVSKGIDSNRLSYVGYGESKLLNNCGNKVKCTEQQHAENRRTEFDIRVKQE